MYARLLGHTGCIVADLFFFYCKVFFNLYDIKRLKMALFSSEQDYYQCLGKLHWNELVLITIILPVYIKSFPIVVKTLLGYVVWWTRDQTHESRGYPTRWSDYSQIESYRYSRSYVVNIIYLLIIVVGKVGLYVHVLSNLYFRMIDWMLIVWTDLYCVSSTNI